MNSFDLNDNFKPQIGERLLKNKKWFNDGFEPEPQRITGTVDIDLVNQYTPEKYELRRHNVKAQPVLIAKDLESFQTVLQESRAKDWWAFWLTEERKFSAKPVSINGNDLIQLVDEETGKLTYISPPETDKFGKKLNRRKRYTVTILLNSWFKTRRFIFTPQLPLETSKDENRRILQEVADTI